jgi:predicted lysophospholipase L1 biosynthesis ABC-type transport system permease subunit
LGGTSGTSPSHIRTSFDRPSLPLLPGDWALRLNTTPRVAVDYGDVIAAGLTGFGSRVAYGWLFNTPDGRDGALVEELAQASKPRGSMRSRRSGSWKTA